MGRAKDLRGSELFPLTKNAAKMLPRRKKVTLANRKDATALACNWERRGAKKIPAENRKTAIGKMRSFPEGCSRLYFSPVSIMKHHLGGESNAGDPTLLME